MDGNEIKTKDRVVKRDTKWKLVWQIFFGKWIGVVFINETPLEGDAIEVDDMIAIFRKK